MNVPTASDPAWTNILTGKTRYQFEFLATNFLLGSLINQVNRDPSPRSIRKCAEELHNIFARNADMRTVQNDLRRIFHENTLGGCMNEVAEVKEKIARGQKLLLAGDEKVLEQIPHGAWIGGTIPYFMTEEGGLSTRDRIYVTELPDSITDISIEVYDKTRISNIYNAAPQNGFSVIIMPGSSATHLEFALNAPKYENFAIRPLVGWIAGVHLNDLGKVKPKVFSGLSGVISEDAAMVMHVTLPNAYAAEVGIVNIFEQGDGDTILFPETSFSVREVEINGVKTNFADYISEKHLDTRLPLVADYFGVMVNVSFQSVDQAKQEVQLYAPVFAGVLYKHAKPIEDYVRQFTSQAPTHLSKQSIFSCNCILNYQYSGLEGKKVGDITGPTTFGEVAYQLLNQTMVYLTITDQATG
jgi:hypothetical protein